MASMKRGIMVASILSLFAIITSACDRSYSQAPAVTNTPIDQNSLFSTPLGQPTGMSDIEKFATETAMAGQTPVPGATSATQATATATLAGVTPQAETVTPTPLISTGSTVVIPTATLAVGPAATLIPAGSVPGTYTLQNGEFPYCIARRFNVDPDELLSINNLYDSQTLYAGKVLTLPQTGHPFPGSRVWHNHPDTYNVTSSSETIYSIACYYGDIDPSAIAQANGLSVGAALSAGQQLSIP